MPLPFPQASDISPGFVWRRYKSFPPDFKDVTYSHKFEDEGHRFRTTNDVTPQRWSIEASGMSEWEAMILDEHYASVGIATPFEFTDREGDTHTGVRYLEFEKSHTKQWAQVRQITLIKYPG